MADVIKTATRDAYGKALVELAGKNDKLIVLDADLAAATKTGMFKKEYPDRFYDCGIAEANMMGVAAGLSTAGFTVFASSFAMFAAGRAFEQVRNTIGYPHLNVKIGATHAGISVGEDGASHQCCEDIGLMRTIPGMTILNPADDVEARLAVFAAAKHDVLVNLDFPHFHYTCCHSPQNLGQNGRMQSKDSPGTFPAATSASTRLLRSVRVRLYQKYGYERNHKRAFKVYALNWRFKTVARAYLP